VGALTPFLFHMGIGCLFLVLAPLPCLQLATLRWLVTKRRVRARYICLHRPHPRLPCLPACDTSRPTTRVAHRLPLLSHHGPPLPTHPSLGGLTSLPTSPYLGGKEGVCVAGGGMDWTEGEEHSTC